MATIERAIPFGSGASLNFEVVGGTTAPSNPKENTIWVNTETAIGEWQFSATEPTIKADGTALQAGDVWIKTGEAGTVKLNALKKNSIIIYPQSCKQWNGSEWVIKESKSYSGGEWKSFKVWFLNGADKYTDVTGGWVKTAGNSLSNTSTGVKLVMGTNWYTRGQTANEIDLGGKTTLYIGFYYYKQGSSATHAKIGTTSANAVHTFSGQGYIVIPVDISNVSTKERLIAEVYYSGSTSENGDTYIELREIYAV